MPPHFVFLPVVFFAADLAVSVFFAVLFAAVFPVLFALFAAAFFSAAAAFSSGVFFL